MMEEEKLVTRFYIEDGSLLYLESTLRTSLLPILSLSLSLTFISFILPGSEDEGLGYFTAFFLMIFLMLYLFITLPTALYLWSEPIRFNLNSSPILASGIVNSLIFGGMLTLKLNK